MKGDVGGAAGYRPRVRSAYYERVYDHSPRGDRLKIGAQPQELKGKTGFRVGNFAQNNRF